MNDDKSKRMPRGRAEQILDEIRTHLAARTAPEVIERYLKRQHGIEPLKACNGAAHENPNIDNCGVCAPRWGWTGERVKVT